MERTRSVLMVVLSTGVAGSTGLGSARATTPDRDVVEVVLDGSVQNPAFSPDGTQLLVTVWRGGYNVGPADLIVVPLDGGQPWELVADGWDNVNLPGSVWNAEANTIVYSSTEDASFSPDGQWVVFSGDDGESSADVWAVEVDGEGLERLTTDPGYEGAPSWSPDRTRIAFEASDGDPDGASTVVRIIDIGEGVAPA